MDDIGHEEIEIDKTGNAQFVFDRQGQFMLVYKYGDEAPYLHMINICLILCDFLLFLLNLALQEC